MNSIRRGRLFDHVELKVKDIDKSKKFYRPVIETLGLSMSFENGKSFSVDEFLVIESEAPTQAVHLAFMAPHPAAVKMFYETALQNGGMCNGAPGERNFHTNYYSAYVLDPDGNNIEAVFHDPNSMRSVLLNSHL
ncbi:VOC family protein [Peredibacter sp. HCB2-198]|uniref:VOC family protein n=1 Tax=Peredibacter sp. HCB2-198 TaxID=3383025 RepID=UPI0038B62F96